MVNKVILLLKIDVAIVLDFPFEEKRLENPFLFMLLHFI